MFKKLRSILNSLFSKISLTFIFSTTIFLIMSITLGITALIAVIQIKLGILNVSSYRRPETAVIFLFVLSLVLGTVMMIFGSKMAMKLMLKIFSAMKELASGNFNIQIRLTGLLRPKELVDFEEEFNDMARELAGIEILRSDFINNFSHEFKTPIVSLRGFAKLLKENNLTPEERNEYLDIIISESERLSDLATNVLNLTKIENQAIITEKNSFNLSEQIRHAILMMESKWSGKDLEIDIDLEEINYYGSEELLSQVWLNLIDNAIKFSHQGGKLEIALQDSSESVIFKIRDYGCGMDANTKSHIFDKFYKGDASHASEGNGLGLTVVHKIISLHKGQILAESIPGQGTLFMVMLPKQIRKSRVI